MSPHERETIADIVEGIIYLRHEAQKAKERSDAANMAAKLANAEYAEICTKHQDQMAFLRTEIERIANTTEAPECPASESPN